MAAEKQDDNSYELALEMKKHTEANREEINKYYTSLFAAIVSAIPFIDKFAGNGDDKDGGLDSNIVAFIILLSIIGITLTFSWLKTLRRIAQYLEAVDVSIKKIERKQGKSLMNDIAKYLEEIDASSRVTKQEMWVPYTFMAVFVMIGSYCGYYLAF